jgi:hypothetical protein
MYVRITVFTKLSSQNGARNIDYQLVRKNVAEAVESISYKREVGKIWENTNRWTGFVSPRNHIKWFRRKRQQVTPKYCQRATRLNGVSAQKRILFEADLNAYSNYN